MEMEMLPVKNEEPDDVEGSQQQTDDPPSADFLQVKYHLGGVNEMVSGCAEIVGNASNAVGNALDAVGKAGTNLWDSKVLQTCTRNGVNYLLSKFKK